MSAADTTPAQAPETLTGQSFIGSGKQPKYTRLSHDEKRQIIALRQNGATMPMIGKALKRDVSTIYEYLKPFEDTRHEALAILQAGAGRAAQAWQDSIEPAAKQGNHKPAKELLAAVGVIQEQAQTQVAVQVNLGQGGESLPADLSFTVDKIESEG